MASFLFITPPFVGHTVATISIAYELSHKGHKVSWITIGDTLKKLIPKGSEWISIEEKSKHREQLQELALYSQQNESKSLEEGLKSLYEESLIPMSELMVEDIEQEINRLQPDLIIVDNCSFGGAIAAYRTQTPYVSIITTPIQEQAVRDNSPFFKWLTQQQIELQKKFGIYEEREIVYSTQLNLVTCPNNFITPLDLEKPFHFIGPLIKHRPSHQKFDFSRIVDNDQPTILISLGTLLEYRQLNFFKKVIDAFKNEDYNIIAVTKKDLITEWPDNFIVKESVPQLELLPHIDIVITHGGANTCCESLYYGIPLIVIPMAYDQYHIANKVVEAGCGIRLKSKRIKAEDLQNSVKEIFLNKNYKNSAKKVKKIFKQTGGTKTAVQLLRKCLIQKDEKKIISY